MILKSGFMPPIYLMFSLVYMPSPLPASYGHLSEPPGLIGWNNAIMARPGDINIGYIADVHLVNSTTGACSSVIPYYACWQLMMSNLAIDQINNSTDILPNITLGMITIDGCSSANLALELSLYFIEGIDKLVLSDDNKKPNTKESRNFSISSAIIDITDWLSSYSIVGVMGLDFSASAVAVSPLLGLYELPIVGCYCTSDDLSDKSTYPYFTRLVAPDSVQAQAIMDMALYFGWSYISIVYSEGAYGENGASQTINAIRSLRESTSTPFTICIAVQVEVPSGANNDDLSTIISTLTSDERARVILSFLTVDDQASLFPLFGEKVALGKLMFIATDSFLGLVDQPTVGSVLVGGIYADHPGYVLPSYYDYSHSSAVWVDAQNEWLKEMWMTTYNCIPTTSTRTVSNVTYSQGVKECLFNSSLVDAACPSFGWAVPDRIYDSVSVFANALHRLIANNCPDAFLGNNSALNGCIQGDVLLEYITNTSMEGIIGKIQFNNEGDLVENLILKQIQLAVDGTLIEVIIGNWSAIAGLSITSKLIDWTIFNNKTNTSQPMLSVCSQPCANLEYIISQSSACCWNCAQCRSNEVIVSNRTACQACPPNTWPDQNTDTICQPITPVYLQLSSSIAVTLICLAGAGALISLLVTTVYTGFGSHPLIKATSRDLCYIIQLGTLFLSIVVIIFSIKPDSDVVCSARNIGFHLAINIVYAPLLIKNIRIYRIFAAARSSAKRPAMTSSISQMIFAIIVTAIQILIVVAMEILLPSVSALQMPSEFIEYVELYCNTSVIAFLVPLAYNILIILICSVIGFMTRRLPENFNESWFIFLSTATTLFSWAVFIPAYFTLGSVYLQSAVLGCCLIINCYVTIGCLFGPILYAVAFVPTERIKIVLQPSSGSTHSRVEIQPAVPEVR